MINSCFTAQRAKFEGYLSVDCKRHPATSIHLDSQARHEQILLTSFRHFVDMQDKRKEYPLLDRQSKRIAVT